MLARVSPSSALFQWRPGLRPSGSTRQVSRDGVTPRAPASLSAPHGLGPEACPGPRAGGDDPWRKTARTAREIAPRRQQAIWRGIIAVGAAGVKESRSSL